MKYLYMLFCVIALLSRMELVLCEGGSEPTVLANWLVGIIAVAVFLVLAFVFLLFNHYVCTKFYDYDDEDLDYHDVEPTSVYEEVVQSKESFKKRDEVTYENAGFNGEMVTEL